MNVREVSKIRTILNLGEGILGLIFAGYLWLASQSPYPIIVYSVKVKNDHRSKFSNLSNWKEEA